MNLFKRKPVYSPPLTQAEHAERVTAARASAIARHRAETAPSVRQGSTGAPSKTAVALFRQGQARPDTRARRGPWDTRSSELPVGSIQAHVTFHFPKAYRSATPDLPAKGRALLVQALARSKKGVAQNLVISNPKTVVDAQRHPAMREIITKTLGVIRDHQAGAITRGIANGLIPKGTHPGLVAQAYKHAALHAVHKAGLLDYEPRMDPAAKAAFRPLVPFMRYANRRVFDKLNVENKGKWDAFREEFGTEYRQRKFGKETGHVRRRMRPNQEFIKIDLGDLEDEILAKAVNGSHEDASSKPSRHKENKSGHNAHSPLRLAQIALARASAAHKAGIGTHAASGVKHIPEPPGGMPPPADPMLHIKDAAIAIERHFGLPRIGGAREAPVPSREASAPLHGGERLLGKATWTESKHPRGEGGKFDGLRAAQLVSGAAGGIGAGMALSSSKTAGRVFHGVDRAANVVGNAAEARFRLMHRRINAGKTLGIFGRHQMQNAAVVARNQGKLLNVVARGAARGTGRAALAGAVFAAGDYAGDRITRAVLGNKAGKKHYRHFNTLGFGLGTLGAVGAHVLTHARFARKIIRRFPLSGRAKLIAAGIGLTAGLEATGTRLQDRGSAAIKDARLGKVDFGFMLGSQSSGPSFGNYDTNPATQLNRAMRPRMRHTRLRLRLNTQRHLRHVLSGGVTRRERWQLGASSGLGGDPFAMGKRSPIDDHADMAAHPTMAQAKAGNYRMGHTTVAGLPVSIETPKGRFRTGLTPAGRSWRVKMPAHYGYVKKTTGADGDHLDVYLGPHAHEAEKHPAYIVDQQHHDTKRFDEHKSMLGFRDLDHATRTYDAAFSDKHGPARRRAVHEVTIADFHHWVANGDLEQPYELTKPGKALTKPRNALTKGIIGAAIARGAGHAFNRLDQTYDRVSAAAKAGVARGTGRIAAGPLGDRARRAAAHPRVEPILRNPRVAAGLHEARTAGMKGIFEPGATAGAMAGAAIGGARGARIGAGIGTAAGYAPKALAIGGGVLAGLGVGRATAPTIEKPKKLKVGTPATPGAPVLGKRINARRIYTTPLKLTLREHVRVMDGGTPGPHLLQGIMRARNANKDAARQHIPAAMAAIAGAARASGALQA
jgi:hypothetical protein